MRYTDNHFRSILFVFLLSVGSANAFSRALHISFDGQVSDVVYNNSLVELGDPVVGVLEIDPAAPNWYGDDPNWGAYEANLVLSYGKVQINSLIALYIDVKSDELFGVARVPIDEEGLTYTDFRFWVQLQDVNSTSLSKAIAAMGSRGTAALLTFDASDTRIQCFAHDIKVSVSSVPEPSSLVLGMFGAALIFAARKSGRVRRHFQ